MLKWNEGDCAFGGFVRDVGTGDIVRALVLFTGNNCYPWVRVRRSLNFLFFCCGVDHAVGGVTGNGQ